MAEPCAIASGDKVVVNLDAPPTTAATASRKQGIRAPPPDISTVDKDSEVIPAVFKQVTIICFNVSQSFWHVFSTSSRFTLMFMPYCSINNCVSRFEDNIFLALAHSRNTLEDAFVLGAMLCPFLDNSLTT